MSDDAQAALHVMRATFDQLAREALSHQARAERFDAMLPILQQLCATQSTTRQQQLIIRLCAVAAIGDGNAPDIDLTDPADSEWDAPG
jgi:hypothetical protein